MSIKKLTEEEKGDWDKLYRYMTYDIFRCNEEQRLPNEVVYYLAYLFKHERYRFDYLLKQSNEK